jgi:hypothetical protein
MLGSERVSRRTFLASVATGSALAAISATDLLPGLTARAEAASPVGDVVGKVSVGYQGWFACPGDGAPIGGWWHWSRDRGLPPSPSNTTIVSWPDVRDFSATYPSGYPNLGNGRPAALFSSYDQQTVNTHFLWMQQNGCDTAALQRFNPMGDEGPTRDAMATKVRTAAEQFGRKFYIMYDVSGWTNFQSEIKADWTAKMAAMTASPAYAKQNGKPVICIWGFGFAGTNNHPVTPAPCLDVINWFKAQGCYVIGGVPTYWRQGINDSAAGMLGVYHAFNMISPWMVGRTGTISGLDSFYTNVNVPDQADCNANGIDYQPCVMPGDLSTGARSHGDFYWRHCYNMIRLGAQGLYVSMFDEFNEGNQIAKTAESAAWVPAGSGIRALDEDGTACSSDYYLRITADVARMLKGQLALTAVRPTQPVLGSTPPTDVNLVAGKSVSATSQTGPYVPANVADADPGSYWESASGAFPQWLTIDLGASYALTRVVLRLPSGWGSRIQSLSVQGSGDGSAFGTLVASGGQTFAPGSGNTVTLTPAVTPTRYLRILVTGNTGWPAAQLSQVEAYGTLVSGPPPTATNLAPGRPTTASSQNGPYTAGNVVDADPGSYWESASGAFPQWFQVDLGAAATLSRVVLRLPSGWESRSQTMALQGSTDGSTFTTLAASAARSFDPATGNSVTIALSGTGGGTPTRYLRVAIAANTGWPAAQLSQLEAYGT